MFFSSSSSTPSATTSTPPTSSSFFSYKCPEEALAELTSDQRERMATLRASLLTPVDAPLLRQEDDDDYHLHRFLRANEYDVDKARAMYERMISWRADFGTDTLLSDFRVDAFEHIKKDYVHFYYKTDRLGRPVYIEQLGKLNMSSIKSVVSTEDMLRFHVREVERLMRVRFEACTRTNAKRKEAAMNNSDNKNDDNDGEKARTDGACTERLGRVGAMLGIIDLDGFGLMKFSSEFVSFLKSISKVDQDNYPEILGTLVVVNAPTVVASVMWPVVRCFLDKRTQDKIKFFSCYQQKAAEECLLSMVDAENLPDIVVGGKARCPHPDGWAFVDEGPWNDYDDLYYGTEAGAWKPPEWRRQQQ